MKIITFYNQKGGVGKTSLTFNIAYLFSLKYRTVMWDLDTQGALSMVSQSPRDKFNDYDKIFKKKGRIRKRTFLTKWDNLFVIPAGEDLNDLGVSLFDFKKSGKVAGDIAKKLSDDFDVMIIDPQATKSLLIENIIKASDYIYMPVIPNSVNMKLIDDNISFIQSCKAGRKIAGIIPNMTDLRKKVHQESIEELKKNYSALYMDVFIPSCSKMEEIYLRLQPIELFAKRSKAALALREIYQKIEAKIL
ncbi:MAG TPA: ParA family protein [Spirochaetota bacterium]|jgi:chromosome partitioning protein|nr:MAG: Sporulation initiation inhibitor protein Soj [Spirochaetes bacterium ADurb.Bin133]HNZ27107.1 ParA family protein [Spirochaetota bacterium]HPY88496.1 ParA family protein [Spirochaetota bacterium]